MTNSDEEVSSSIQLFVEECEDILTSFTDNIEDFQDPEEFQDYIEYLNKIHCGECYRDKLDELEVSNPFEYLIYELHDLQDNIEYCIKRDEIHQWTSHMFDIDYLHEVYKMCEVDRSVSMYWQTFWKECNNSRFHNVMQPFQNVHMTYYDLKMFGAAGTSPLKCDCVNESFCPFHYDFLAWRGPKLKIQ